MGEKGTFALFIFYYRIEHIYYRKLATLFLDLNIILVFIILTLIHFDHSIVYQNVYFGVCTIFKLLKINHFNPFTLKGLVKSLKAYETIIVLKKI